jgi:flavorubredoxin
MEKKDDRVTDITRDVKWIGVLDYDIKTFDIVMTTEYGTTYNSYFINAEKKAIIEIAKEKFFDVYLRKLNTVTNPREISYIIVNHTEPDHTGALRQLLDIVPSAVVVGSGNAIRYLYDIVDKPFRSLVVKGGDTLDLGNKTLKFISTPNLHWPDSMISCLVEDKVLFTCDVFGAHYCKSDMVNDFSAAYLKAYNYYFNVILKPYSRFMLKALEKVKTLEFNVICPGHGPVHKHNIREIIDVTEKLSVDYLNILEPGDGKRILITYISAYGFTKMAAEHIASGIRETDNTVVDIVDIENLSLEELDARIASSDALMVGSPTINQNTLLPVYKLFSVINPVRDRGKLAGVFGSYGWSGEAPVIITENLKNLKMKVFDEPAVFKFYPGEDKASGLKEYGRKFIARFQEESNKKEDPGI